jgi:hypothetical protein
MRWVPDIAAKSRREGPVEPFCDNRRDQRKPAFDKSTRTRRRFAEGDKDLTVDCAVLSLTTTIGARLKVALAF